MVSFEVSSADRDLIEKIVERAHRMEREYCPASDRRSRQSIAMDITAVHANGNPLRLADFLAADEFNFAHDLFGIRNCLDRETGKLTMHFSPRFSRREAA